MKPLPVDTIIWQRIFELAKFEITPEQALERICSAITPDVLASVDHRYFFESWKRELSSPDNELLEFWYELENSGCLLRRIMETIIKYVRGTPQAPILCLTSKVG